MQAKLKQIINEYKKVKVKTIRVKFSGHGDEGAINCVESTPLMRCLEFDDELKNALYDYLNDKGDWYNNEGGGGTIEIDVVKGTISCDMYFNEIVRNYKHFNG